MRRVAASNTAPTWVTRAPKVRPGSAVTFTSMSWPTWMNGMSISGTNALSHMVERSATT